ncbi:hypothetical protein DRN77_04450 [Methanosarcinales archaeon]|nr:MAG: hypothetical protein DRN77_04450 [Methanosarcinales archaeon]
MCPQGWLEDYHKRSISETVNFMVKCRFGAPPGKETRSAEGDCNTALKLVAHNIQRAWYFEIMGDVAPHWRRQRCM